MGGRGVNILVAWVRELFGLSNPFPKNKIEIEYINEDMKEEQMSEKTKPWTAREIATEMCKRSQMKIGGKEVSVAQMMGLLKEQKGLLGEIEGARLGHCRYNCLKGVK